MYCSNAYKNKSEVQQSHQIFGTTFIFQPTTQNIVINKSPQDLTWQDNKITSQQ